MSIHSKTSKLKKASKPSGLSDVAEFMNKLKHPLKEAIETLREVILSSDKKITEHIKWNAPSFCFNGEDRVTLNLSKKECVMIIFHRGAKVKDVKGKETLFEDPTELLQWLSPDRAMVKLLSREDVIVKKAKLKRVVKQWITATS